MLMFKPNTDGQYERIEKMFDACDGYDAIVAKIVMVGEKSGAKVQAAVVNTLYKLVEGRGRYSGGMSTLGNTISVQQNDAVQRYANARPLTEIQAWQIARDLMSYTAKELSRNG